MINKIEIILIFFVSLMGVGLVLYALSGKCKCNGVDMPKTALLAIEISFVGNFGELVTLLAYVISNCPL